MDQTPAAGISSSPNANNSEHEKDKVSKLHNQVDELRDIMHDNVTNIVERGERLVNLEENANALQQNSASFSRGGAELRNVMRRKNLKWKIILTAVILIVSSLVVILTLHWFGLF